jgi:hypothetical protein
VYGGELTACILPPLAELRADPVFVAASQAATVAAAAVASGVSASGDRAGAAAALSITAAPQPVPPITLELLRGELVSVPAAAVYEVPGKAE